MHIATIAAICSAIVAIGAIHYAHSRRPLSERLVDSLYTMAAIMYSMAQAADAAIVRYRKTRQEIRECHEPLYVEVIR